MCCGMIQLNRFRWKPILQRSSEFSLHHFLTLTIQDMPYNATLIGLFYIHGFSDSDDRQWTRSWLVQVMGCLTPSHLLNQLGCRLNSCKKASMKFNSTHIHTPTHTYMYIYIYIYYGQCNIYINIYIYQCDQIRFKMSSAKKWVILFQPQCVRFFWCWNQNVSE